MSDKKQPAQQRVNVRIVKADDPEQRGGMKPIAKADGSLQISPEEAYTAGIWTKPPFDLRGLSKMVDESTILPQCIRAYKSNIAGFGIDIRYKDDFADADETPEMKAEWDRATEVVEMLNMEQESNELFEDIVEARETYGCAYAEVIRDMDGNVIQLEFIEDTPSVEKSRRLDPRVEVTYFHRDHTENRMRKFRKYKQTVNAENRPEVEVKDLAAILQKDELFQDYLENNRRKVQSAFQLPDLYTGYTTDFNRATAQTAMEVTEKQVFQPERRRLAWAINNRLLNCYQFKYVEVFFRAPDVSNPDDLYKLLTVCNNAGGLTPNKAKSVLYKALGETSEDFPEEWGDIPLAFTNAQQRAAATAVAGNIPSVAQNGSSVTGKENTQPEGEASQNARQGAPSVEEQLDGQIQKAAAANETEIVAVMKEVRRLLADMKQEEGDAE